MWKGERERGLMREKVRIDPFRLLRKRRAASGGNYSARPGSGFELQVKDWWLSVLGSRGSWIPPKLEMRAWSSDRTRL